MFPTKYSKDEEDGIQEKKISCVLLELLQSANNQTQIK